MILLEPKPNGIKDVFCLLPLNISVTLLEISIPTLLLTQVQSELLIQMNIQIICQEENKYFLRFEMF